MTKINVGSNHGGVIVGGDVAGSHVQASATADREMVFDEIRAALSPVERTERERIFLALSDFQIARGSEEKTSKYGTFLQLAGKHVALIQPFIPALTALLKL